MRHIVKILSNQLLLKHLVFRICLYTVAFAGDHKYFSFVNRPLYLQGATGIKLVYRPLIAVDDLSHSEFCLTEIHQSSYLFSCGHHKIEDLIRRCFSIS